MRDGTALLEAGHQRSRQSCFSGDEPAGGRLAETVGRDGIAGGRLAETVMRDGSALLKDGSAGSYSWFSSSFATSSLRV